ncbi:MAG: hypothetical protein HY922_16990 [Elusimicrobia bacterium]|nr:hypothetical protein [Elusimicrobiota bacterium]
MSNEKKSEKEEERKGGGVPWMSQSAAVGARLFGGSQAMGIRAAFSAMMQSKALLLALAAGAAGYSTWGLLDIHGRGGFGVTSTKPGGTFFSPQMGSQAGGLPGMGAAGSSLDMARAANQGAWGGEAAKAEPSAAGDASASADAGQEAAAPDAGAMANAAAGDPAAAAADAMKAASGPGALARLSSGLGGSGSGGGTSASMAAAPAAGRGSQIDQLARGRVPVQRTNTRGSVPANNRGGRIGPSTALRRLSNMNKVMKGVGATNPEFASGVHTGQWSGSNPGGAGVAGPSQSGAGTGTGPSSNEGVGHGSAITDTKGYSYDDKEIKPPDITESGNKTPYQFLVDTATVLLNTAAALTMLAFLLWLGAKFGIPHLAAAAAVVSKLAAALAFAAAACGAAIIATSGQWLQGLIFVGVGGLMGLLALKSAVDPKAAIAKQVARQAAMKLSAYALGRLGPGAGKWAGRPGGLEFAKNLGRSITDGIKDYIDRANKDADRIADRMENAREAIEKAKKELK